MLPRAILIAIASSMVVAAASAPAWAGAFTLRDGEAKVFVTGLTMSGDRYFDADGKLRKRDRYRKTDLQLFAEYGVKDGLTAFGAIALQKIDVSDARLSKREGLGRSEIGLRARLFERGPWIGSVQSSVTIAGATKSDGVAAIGETDDQIDIRGLVARSFEAFGKPGFIDLQAGYRTRSGDPANEIRLDATLGLRALPRLLVLAQSFNTLGQGGWRGPYALKQRIHKLQFATLYDLTERLQLTAAVFATPAAQDALYETGAVVGLGYHF